MVQSAFVVFAICCIAQFWLVQRVASALESRHAARYRQMRDAIFTTRLHWFALTRADRDLGDSDLSKRTKQLQILIIAAYGSWLVGAVLLVTGHR